MLQRAQGSSKAPATVWLWVADEQQRASWLAELTELWRLAHVRRKAATPRGPLLQLLIELGMAKWYEPLAALGLSIPNDVTALEQADFDRLGMTSFERGKLRAHVYEKGKEMKNKPN